MSEKNKTNDNKSQPPPNSISGSLTTVVRESDKTSQEQALNNNAGKDVGSLLSSVASKISAAKQVSELDEETQIETESNDPKHEDNKASDIKTGTAKQATSKISWGNLDNIEISTEEDKNKLYDFFTLSLAKDILKYNLTDEDEINKLFENYVQTNKGLLDEGRMREEIEGLKTRLELPLPKREQECVCEEESLDETDVCECCPAYQVPPGTSLAGSCQCGNLKCPGRDFVEEVNKDAMQ